MIHRPLYITPLRESIGTPLIKVITGMRRVGKSTLLIQLRDSLIQDGILDSHILFIDREDYIFEHISDAEALYRETEGYFHEKSGKKYLLIDEVQDIKEWEKIIRHYAKLRDYEVYITGSNSQLLSSELGTYLSGRYIEFPVYPLSYQEFLSFKPTGNLREFMEYGWLPGVALLPDSVRSSYIEWVLSTVLIRDVIERYEIRNGVLLSDILRYLAANIGYPTSTNKIAQYLKKERISLAFETVREYISYFRKSFFLSSPVWIDILGKKHLDLHWKYYFTDLGIRNSLIWYRDEYVGQILENIVYNELIIRGYTVMVGSVWEYEVDFVATKKNEKIYIQVCYTLSSPETIEREFIPLEAIPDNYPKYVLSLDRDWGSGRGGIHRLHIEDWLLWGL